MYQWIYQKKSFWIHGGRLDYLKYDSGTIKSFYRKKKIRYMPYTNGNWLKYGDQIFETDKKYRRLFYVPNKVTEKSTAYWGENGLNTIILKSL